MGRIGSVTDDFIVQPLNVERLNELVEAQQLVNLFLFRLLFNSIEICVGCCCRWHQSHSHHHCAFQIVLDHMANSIE